MALFPCSQCGQCCRNLDKSELYAGLDRGDGTCLHLDESTHACAIYEQRPDICRVMTFYERHLAAHMDRDDYINQTLIVCQSLQTAGGRSSSNRQEGTK